MSSHAHHHWIVNVWNARRGYANRSFAVFLRYACARSIARASPHKSKIENWIFFFDFRKLLSVSLACDALRRRQRASPYFFRKKKKQTKPTANFVLVFRGDDEWLKAVIDRRALQQTIYIAWDRSIRSRTRTRYRIVSILEFSIFNFPI